MATPSEVQSEHVGSLEEKGTALAPVETNRSLFADTVDTMEQGKAEGKPESKDEENTDNIVWWEEPADQDPNNPQAWPSSRKWLIISILSFITFLTPLASSMLAPGVPQIMQEFQNSSNTFATFVVSIFVLGFAIGPLFIAPLSEIYGRSPIYNVCNVLFVAFSIMCAESKNSSMLLAARFLAGLAGVATITCGGGTISDMMPPAQRGRSMALWSMGPLLGPVIGPVIGGVLVEKKGWRWVFWLITILSGFITIVAFFFMRETYAPVILERKAARLRKETGNQNLRSKFATGETNLQILKGNVFRPMVMLATFPIVTMMCIYIAFLYGALYILFTTFTFVFEGQYGFSTSTAGLSFLGSGIGSFLGLAYAGTFSDREVKRKQASGTEPQPEDRLPLLLILPASISLPIGLFIYGWTTNYKVHWIVPEIGTVIVGFGMITILMCIQTYLIDAYTRYAASVTAANAVLRSLLGALLPLCGLQLYDALGLGWGNSLLAFIALAMAPLPLVFRLFGARLRSISAKS